MANVILNFNMQHQVNSNWCWAANSTSVSHFYDAASGWTQCKVACSALSINNCCAAPTPANCNVSYYLNLALTVTGNFVSMVGNPLNMAQIETEINAKKVIGVRIGWNGGGGHFIAIYGYFDLFGIDFVFADDPIYGKTAYNLATFTNNYQGAGKWTHSYYTKPTKLRMINFAEIDKILLERAKAITPGKFVVHPVIKPGSIPKEMPHETYVIDFNSLKGGKVEATLMGLRIIDSTENNNHYIFEYSSNDSAATLQQIIQGKDFTDNYHSTLEKSIENKISTNKPYQLRVVKQPELKVEAVWLHQDGPVEKDEYIPLFSNDFLTTGTTYPQPEFFSLLKNAASKREVIKDDEIGG